jgi:hypothetical protein
LFASQNIPVTNLGIGQTGTASFTTNYFTPASASINDTFFLGYTANFNLSSGDTIGVKTTIDGYRYAPYYSTNSNNDTIINVKNASQESGNTWVDNAFENFQLGNHLVILPILKIDYLTSVSGVSKNNFTLFGNYPNPAINSTNIKISLKRAADVTVSVTDMNGRVISSFTKQMGTGEQIIPLETTQLATGNYIYVVRTSEGDGLAATFSVAK